MNHHLFITSKLSAAANRCILYQQGSCASNMVYAFARRHMHFPYKSSQSRREYVISHGVLNHCLLYPG